MTPASFAFLFRRSRTALALAALVSALLAATAMPAPVTAASPAPPHFA